MMTLFLSSAIALVPVEAVHAIDARKVFFSPAAQISMRSDARREVRCVDTSKRKDSPKAICLTVPEWTRALAFAERESRWDEQDRRMMLAEYLGRR